MREEYYEPEQVFDLLKLQDRGSKKWVAMMLPEHVALLREYSKEIKREPKPDLDKWDYDAIQHTLDAAIKSKADTIVKLWRDGEFIYNRGTIENVNLHGRTIEMGEPFTLMNINLDEIVDVTIMD